jgi:hypothetical protein
MLNAESLAMERYLHVPLFTSWAGVVMGQPGLELATSRKAQALTTSLLNEYLTDDPLG